MLLATCYARRTVVSVALAACVAPLIAKAVKACGPYLSLRPYLTRSFWLPMYFTVNNLLPPEAAGGSVPYAGFSFEAAPPALSDLRAAYAPLARTVRPETEPSTFEEARRVASHALAPGVLAGQNLEEARLIDCKIALRLAESKQGTLDEARRKLDAFIAAAITPAYASEARGWLARVLYLQKDYVRAALIYLDETRASDSPLNRGTLVDSLRWVYSDGEAQLWDRAEEFFDNPRHALFLVNLITNQRSYYPTNENSRRLLNERGRKVLGLLQSHPGLFKFGADSDGLTLALMRTALYMGDLTAASKFAAVVPKSSSLMENPEFNWMVAIARFTSHDFAGAEAPLLRMLTAPSASREDQATAAQALVGVYLKRHRHADALHAAFVQNSRSVDIDTGPDVISPRAQFCSYCQDLGLPYLLDVFLTDAELRAYLEKYPEPDAPPLRVFGWDDSTVFSPSQVVTYSLAVRHARREEYAEAAKLFADVGAGERAEHMKALAALVSRSRDPALPARERLAALYDYGVHLASNPNRLFFNDLLWFRMQTYVFEERYTSAGRSRGDLQPQAQPGWSRIERETILADDRKLRDEQEERWKAFHVLERVARGAGRSELGRKAAAKIVECLGAINVSRFGRGPEIGAAIAYWNRWLNAR